MPHIPYANFSSITDPDILGYLERARKEGTPRPETQSIRSHVPAVALGFTRGWNQIFRAGIVEHPLKELCRVYVSKTIDCHY